MSERCEGCFNAEISGCIDSVVISGLTAAETYYVKITDHFGNEYTKQLVANVDGKITIYDESSPYSPLPEGFFQLQGKAFTIEVFADEEMTEPVLFESEEGVFHDCIFVSIGYSATEVNEINPGQGSVCPDHPSLCERVLECLPGFISTDEGNALRVGDDGKLYVPESGGGLSCEDLPGCQTIINIEESLTEKANSADLATVATTGSYNDLSDQPSIPAAQIQSDWNQANNAALDFIKNKPLIPTVPTDVSAFVNDANYITLAQSRGGGYMRFFADFGATSVNTNTSNVVLGAVLIPANTVTGNAILEIETAISRAVGGGNPLHRLIINTSASFTGATQIAGISNSTTALWAKGERSFKAQTGILRGYNATNNQGIDDISNANAPTQTAVNWTVNQYILTVANNATGETTTHEYTTVKVLVS